MIAAKPRFATVGFIAWAIAGYRHVAQPLHGRVNLRNRVIGVLSAMASSVSVQADKPKRGGRHYGTFLAALAVCVVVALWAWRAFSDSRTYDFGLAYFAGGIAWNTGHPEGWISWTGTPTLAAAMAATSRIWDATTASRLLTGLNVALIVVTIAIVVRRLRNVLSPLWLWVVALGLASFGPVLSTVWWKQFNIIVLVLAVAGFAALRRDRVHLSGGLIGLSLAIKPLAILLPFVLLARRSTRSAGVWAGVYAIGLSLGCQGLLALHAHSVGAFDPISSVDNLADKSKPRFGLSCSSANFSPQALLCRTFGSNHWNLFQLVAWAAIAILAVWVVRTLSGYGTASWESFAFSCAFSIMASPINLVALRRYVGPVVRLVGCPIHHGQDGGGLLVRAGGSIRPCFPHVDPVRDARGRRSLSHPIWHVGQAQLAHHQSRSILAVHPRCHCGHVVPPTR